MLHQELLVNITPAGPVPNFMVYSKPWYRDGAVMAMAFSETGILELIPDWIVGLPDAWTIPQVTDGYSALFWRGYRQNHVAGKDSQDRGAYPYLGWACDHFHGTKLSPIGDRNYLLKWEQVASQADYTGMNRVHEVYVKSKLSTPHAWPAAEVLLYRLGTGKPDVATAREL